MNMFKSIKYNSLVKLYRHKIYTYSWYFTRNRMDADDVTQETLIRLWENIEYFKEESTKAWIMRTTHNLCLDYLRRRQKAVIREFHPDCEDDGDAEDFEDFGNSPETIAHLHIVGERITDAVQCLPEMLRSVFVLYEIDNFKHKEISEILKIPEGTVKVYLMRARRALQRELKGYEK
jgi:RNA polymerase sigma-70 factor (ECF subfamily)